MTRCARGRGRESPKKTVKRKEERKRGRGRERERKLARISRNISTIESYPRRIIIPLPLSFSSATPSSGKPVASPLPPPSSPGTHPFATPSSGNSCYSLPACLAKRNSRGSSLYAEFPGVIQENLVPSLFRVSEDLHLRLR